MRERMEGERERIEGAREIRKRGGMAMTISYVDQL